MKNHIRRLKIPQKAYKDEIITVKTMAEHDMESGVRRNNDTGIIYPKLVIQKVEVRYNGTEVFSANWFSGVSANPFMSFKLKVSYSGLVEVEWIDDYGSSTKLSDVIRVYDKNNKEILPISANLQKRN